jgi:hypothetical protein
MASGPLRQHTHHIMFTSRNHTTLSADDVLEIARERVDEAFDLYLDWRRQSSVSESAYRHWVATANSRDGALAFATYKAALDREEQAAARYEHAVLGN